MQAIIDPELCIGCESCVDLAPEVFEMQDELAVVILDEIPADLEEKVRESVEICPVEAIRIEE
jgi:ferredoxin